jgi:putative ABC transport system permease protein
VKPAARQALTRMAWRDIKRNRWRSLLVIVMIALPITGMTIAGTAMSTIWATGEETATGEMGTAQLALFTDDDPVAAENLIARFPDGTWSARYVWDAETIANGSRLYVHVDDIALDDPVLGPIYRLREGRAPAAPGEIAVSPEVLKRFDANVGDTIELGDDGAPYRIVGTVVRAENLAMPVAIVVPGSLAATPGAYLMGMYGTFPDTVSQESINAVLETIHVGHELRRNFSLGLGTWLTSVGVSLGIGVLVLAETGLIAAAAFVIGTRRQLRTIGLVEATGGETVHARALVLSGGLLLGLVGSVAGVVIGLMIALLLDVTGVLQLLGNRIVGSLSVPWLLPIGAIVLGTVAAIIAAYLPARGASRLSTLRALAGRMPPPRPPGALARWGVIGVVAGVPITMLGVARSYDWAVFLGPGLTIVGFLVTIPFLVSLIGHSATRMPLTARIASRDAGRHGRRTGAAVAAATLALILPVSVSTATLSSDAKWNAEPYMAVDQLVVDLPASADGFFGDAAQSFFSRLETEVLPGAVAAPETYAWQPEESTGGEFGGLGPMPVFASGPMQLVHEGNTVYNMTTTEAVYVGGADLLYVVHGEAALDKLEAGYAVAVVDGLVDHGVVHVEDPFSTDFTANGLPTRDIAAVDASTGVYTTSGGDVPKLIISPERAKELGFHTEPASRAVVRATSPVTDEQLANVKSLASEFAGVSVFGLADTRYGSGPLRAALLAFAAVIALAIIAVAVALVAAESRRDRAILAAVGAAPNTRRFVAGYRALLLTGLAGWLAIPAGFLPVTVIQISSREHYPFVVPWLTFAAVAVLLPVVAGAAGALFSRRPATAQMLRPIA